MGMTNVMDSLEGGMGGYLTTFDDTTVTITYERAPTSDSRSAELTLVAIDNEWYMNFNFQRDDYYHAIGYSAGLCRGY